MQAKESDRAKRRQPLLRALMASLARRTALIGFVTSITVAVVTDKLTKLDILGLCWKGLKHAVTALWVPVRLPAGVLLSMAAVAVWLALLASIRRAQATVPEGTGFEADAAMPQEPQRLNVDMLLREHELPRSVALALLGYQNDNPLLAYQFGLCGLDYEPGTFTLEEITPGSAFLLKPEAMETWLMRTINEELELIAPWHADLVGDRTNREIAHRVKSLLLCGVEGGLRSMGHDTWYQEYSDVLLRLISAVLTGHPETEFVMYPGLTTEATELVMATIRKLGQLRSPEPVDWLYLSIAAGLVGVDEKSRHSATSAIYTAGTIRLPEGESIDERATLLANTLWDAAMTKTRIDASMTFFHQLASSSWRVFRLVSFPNDYIETIFLLKLYSELMKEYPNLRIDLVPRSIRYGNDFSYADWEGLIRTTGFGDLFEGLTHSPRFTVHPFGPKLSTVNLRKLDPRVMSLITACDIIDVRGARNYEMMQGVNKEGYFSFMVCREISESITGLSAKDRPLVLLRQRAGERSFAGFRERHKRLVDGRMLCRMTVLDAKKKWEGGHLASFATWSDEAREHFRVTEEFYGRNAPYFHQRFGDHLEKEVQTALAAIHGRVLVLGCGSGKEVRYLADHGQDAQGIDFSDEAIFLARSLSPQLWNRYHVEDMYNIATFESGQFDGIVANAVFVHLLERSDLQLMMDAAASRLAPNGLLYVRLLEKLGKTQEYDNHLFRRPRWFVYYSSSELEASAKTAGLQVLETERMAHAQYGDVFWVSVMCQQK